MIEVAGSPQGVIPWGDPAVVRSVRGSAPGAGHSRDVSRRVLAGAVSRARQPQAAIPG
jgi:hypothetical protein